MKTIKYILLVTVLTFCGIYAQNGDMASRVVQLEQKFNTLLQKTKECNEKLNQLANKLQQKQNGGEYQQPVSEMMYEEEELED
jgi:hypothetical protein